MNRVQIISLIILGMCVLFASAHTEAEHYVTAIEHQSPYSGSDNNDRTLDPAKASCLYYVTQKRGWNKLFEEDADGRKRQYAISAMQSARGLMPESGTFEPYTVFDACVIPKEVLTTYSIDKQCKMKTTKGDVQFDKTLHVMIPEGCFIDFSGKLGSQSKDEMTQDQFGDMLLRMYEGMNYADDKLIKELKSSVEDKDREIRIREEKMNAKEEAVKVANMQLDAAKKALSIATGELPSFIWDQSWREWVVATKNNYVGTWRQTGITAASNMSITFWINITETRSYYRNIIHVTRKVDFGPDELPYDPNEDWNRKPAIFITPGINALHVCHDTTTQGNNAFNVDGMTTGKYMVGLIWSGRTITVYINDDIVSTKTMDGEFLNADPSAFVFVCDRFYDVGGFTLRNMAFYNTALSRDLYLQKFKMEKGNMI